MRGVDWKQPPYASFGATALCCAVVLAAAASLPYPTRDARSSTSHTSRIPDAEIAAGVSLSDIDNPEEMLASKVVQTTMGEEVGRVAKVLLSPDGAPRAVDIELAKRPGAKRKARVDPENLLYLPQRDAVVMRFNSAETAELLRNGREVGAGP